MPWFLRFIRFTAGGKALAIQRPGSAVMVSDNVFKVRSVPERVKATPGVFSGVFSAILRQTKKFFNASE